jgi:hypothetical protein
MAQTLAQDAKTQAGQFGARRNAFGSNAGRAAQAANMADSLGIDRSRADRWASAQHGSKGIAGGDAAAPGDMTPAVGRQTTQRNANFRYRHTTGGRAHRAAQAVRHRHFANPGARAAFLAHYGIHLIGHAV